MTDIFSEINWTHLDATDSTNAWLRRQPEEGKPHLVWADFQTMGRGQQGNHWESEAGRNLLFSLSLPWPQVAASNQFLLSQWVSVGLYEVLQATMGVHVSVKWPNDLYWQERKLGGMLIENQIRGGQIVRSIIGIGLNVNQSQFPADIPNPVSLCHILGHETDCLKLLQAIACRLWERWTEGLEVQAESLRQDYQRLLFRRDGMYRYMDAHGAFHAAIEGIGSDGRLHLRDEHGQERVYAFKEVKYILENRVCE